MVSQAPERHMIKIDGKPYRINGRVQRFPVSQRPGKITIGNYSDFSNPMASEYSIGDLRDGLGVQRGETEDDSNHIWWGTAQIRHRDAIVLGRRVVTTAVGPSSAVGIMEIFKSEVYATYGTAVHLYNNTTDAWGASIRTIAAAATDAAVGLVGGTETLVIANGTDVDYATDSSTWAENTGQAIKYIVFWNDLLWGITNAGQMYYTDDLSAAWTVDALLQLPAGSIKKLIVGRGTDGEQRIYAVTDQGMQIHDSANARFVPTDLSDLPFHPDGGKGAVKWRGGLYYSAGSTIYEFLPGPEGTSIDNMGPGDTPDGLPGDKRGAVNQILASHNELIAFVDASAVEGASNITTRVSTGLHINHGITFSGSSGFSSILGWNRRGWEAKWLSGTKSRAITAGVIGNAYSEYRMWWASNRRVHYMALPNAPVNPVEVTTQEYNDEDTFETPWMDMGIRNQQKLALSAIIDTINPTADETVTVEYATNLVETFTRVAVQDQTGEVEYRLPDRDDNRGVPFRYWKWRVRLNRGATVKNTPQLVRLTLTWLPRIETIWGVRTNLDLTEEYMGRPPVEQEKDLDEAFNAGRLVEVSYKDDASEDRTYLMDFLQVGLNEEAGGPGVYGSVAVTLAEPIATNERFLHERG